MMLMTTAVGTFAYNIKVNSVEFMAVAMVRSVVSLWVRMRRGLRGWVFVVAPVDSVLEPGSVN